MARSQSAASSESPLGTSVGVLFPKPGIESGDTGPRSLPYPQINWAASHPASPQAANL